MVSSNADKAREVAEFFGSTIEVIHVSLDIPELRSEDVTEISRQKAHYAFDRLHSPLIVDDTVFCIDALKGFPGPYAAYVLHTIGNTGILKIMKDVEDRNAHFTTAIAFADSDGIRVFFRNDQWQNRDKTSGERRVRVRSDLRSRGPDTCRDPAWREKQNISPGAGSYRIPGMVHAGICTFTHMTQMVNKSYSFVIRADRSVFLWQNFPKPKPGYSM